MRIKVWNIINFIAGIMMIATVKIWAPVCGGLLTLDTGKQVHMKCFYAGQTAVVLGIILVVLAVVSMLAKKDYKLVQVASIIVSLLVFWVFTSLIGVCVADMACHTTRIWAYIISIISIISSVIDLLSGNKEDQLPE